MAITGNAEILIARWAELVNDPGLRDLPCKIELSAEGTFEMSPANNWQAGIRGYSAWLLGDRPPHGAVMTKCSILTEIGVRVPDAAWGSPDFVKEQGTNTPFTRAPEICVEIASPSNNRTGLEAKVKAHLAAGAREVWLASAGEGIAFFCAEGRTERSAYVPDLRLPA